MSRVEGELVAITFVRRINVAACLVQLGDTRVPAIAQERVRKTCAVAEAASQRAMEIRHRRAPGQRPGWPSGGSAYPGARRRGEFEGVNGSVAQWVPVEGDPVRNSGTLRFKVGVVTHEHGARRKSMRSGRTWSMRGARRTMSLRDAGKLNYLGRDGAQGVYEAGEGRHRPKAFDRTAPISVILARTRSATGGLHVHHHEADVGQIGVNRSQSSSPMACGLCQQKRASCMHPARQ